MPPAVVYRMVSTWAVFKHPRIQSLIHTYPPAEPISGWPTDIVPSGILVLLIHDNPGVRKWAIAQASKCDIVPIPNEQFVETYIKAIESIGRASTAIVEDSTFSFASSESDLWHGLVYILRYTPAEAMKSNSQQNVDLRRIVLGHVHDIGPR